MVRLKCERRERCPPLELSSCGLALPSHARRRAGRSALLGLTSTPQALGFPAASSGARAIHCSSVESWPSQPSGALRVSAPSSPFVCVLQRRSESSVGATFGTFNVDPGRHFKSNGKTRRESTLGHSVVSAGERRDVPLASGRGGTRNLAGHVPEVVLYLRSFVARFCVCNVKTSSFILLPAGRAGRAAAAGAAGPALSSQRFR